MYNPLKLKAYDITTLIKKTHSNPDKDADAANTKKPDDTAISSGQKK